ncbi:peptidase family M13 [Dictyocaulus viviparus]|uniref:Peptidase family M13 n=1 Tax=Dictyocaulus viviparus TaxID=29172 RepID=A0A0D8XS08_DICVI|nr:peptidase family M13 [Dictyocaulus viviparus]
MAIPIGFTASLVVVAAATIACVVLNTLIFIRVNNSTIHKDDKDYCPNVTFTTIAPDTSTAHASTMTAPDTSTAHASTTTAPDTSTPHASTMHSKVKTTTIITTELTQPYRSPSTKLIHVNDTIYCPSFGEADHSPAWQKAASYLMSAIDQNMDPCEDFYAFTCNNFIKHAKASGGSQSTFDQAQADVNAEILKALKSVNISDDKNWSLTERVTKAAVYSCLSTIKSANSNHAEQILNDIAKWFGGIPFLNVTVDDGIDLFKIMGAMELTHSLPTLMSSWVSVDSKNITQNALYLSQPTLPIPRDYYVLPQFASKLEERVTLIKKMLLLFSKNVLDDTSPYYLMIKEAAEEVAKFEMDIAKASWPDTEMRNYAQQYNPYKLDDLAKAYPSINWKSYFENLLISVENSQQVVSNQVVVAQPSYIGWLNSIFAGNHVKKTTIVNFMITQLLFEEADFLSSDFRKLAIKADYVRYAQKRGRGITRIGRQVTRRFDGVSSPSAMCLDVVMTYMPYGPGYVYVKSQKNRDEIVKDPKQETELIIKSFQRMMSTLKWMSDTSLEKARMKVTELVKNFGWPQDLFGDFKNFTAVDAYHKLDYGPIIDAYIKNHSDFYPIINLMRMGFENREAFRLITQPANRSNFLQSPALVNAWYQPERNSITLPYAIWSTPYYSYEYPKSIKFAILGGTVGHELVHGFDDEGVQYGPNGSLIGCSWHQCGWMDGKTKTGFTDMAQCVVTQYSTQCCPEKLGNVHCANGATTQGENIADLGGQQAAYLAYTKYMKMQGHEEKRLPALEQFTPKQIFWIAYGYSWCTSQTDSSLIKQLLTNVHAPSSCRTNQVVQDIPEFGQDFGCKMGQRMYPLSEQRCKVWVGR